MNTGEKIHELRKNKGLLQEELGTLIGVDTSVISRWESSQRQIKIEDLTKLSDLFEVSVDYLAKDNVFYSANIPLIGYFEEGKSLQTHIEKKKLLIFIAPPHNPWEVDIFKILNNNPIYKVSNGDFCLIKKQIKSIEIGDIYLISDNNKPYLAHSVLENGKIGYKYNNQVSFNASIIGKFLSIVHPLSEM